MSLKDKIVIYLAFSIKMFLLLQVSFSEQKFVVSKDYIQSIVRFQATHTHTLPTYTTTMKIAGDGLGKFSCLCDAI